jgi:hypothetical protein
MNEPPNPSDQPPPSSDSTPPPPPPPFTPPPAASQELPSSPGSSPPPPPRPPIYTPPPVLAAKKSPLPWILGGCGCLTFILIAIVIVALATYRAKQKVTEFKTDFKSALQAIDDKKTPTSTLPPLSSQTETRSSKAGWTTYINTKENLPAALQPNFVAFSFEYPKSFTAQPQGEVNFIKVEKYATAGKGSTAENFAVGFAWFDPPSAQSDALYDKLLDDLGRQLTSSFHNYRELKRAPATVAGVQSRAALFQADFDDPSHTMIWGKTIVVHPPGKKNGVTILLLGTALGRDIHSADDLGVKGESAEILRSFRFL